MHLNKNIELKAGMLWIKKSFYIFREKPIQFIILSLINIFIEFIPILGTFLSPVFTAKFAKLTQKVENNEQIFFKDLVSGYFINQAIITLSLLSLVFNTIITFLPYIADQMYFNHFYFKIISLLLLLILQLSLWLSPLICLYNDKISPLNAMLLSLKAGFYNIPSIIIYSLLIVFYTILAILPIGLGFLILLPIVNISSYYIYRDIYS